MSTSPAYRFRRCSRRCCGHRPCGGRPAGPAELRWNGNFPSRLRVRFDAMAGGDTMTSPDRVKFLTVHSPVKPYRIVWLRSMLKIGEIFPGIMGIRPLDAVYFTRWSIVTSIPYNG
nr:hypothetical protein GCM10020092_052630 [Actinoplanes digitatis]